MNLFFASVRFIVVGLPVLLTLSSIKKIMTTLQQGDGLGDKNFLTTVMSMIKNSSAVGTTIQVYNTGEIGMLSTSASRTDGGGNRADNIHVCKRSELWKFLVCIFKLRRLQKSEFSNKDKEEAVLCLALAT